MVFMLVTVTAVRRIQSSLARSAFVISSLRSLRSLLNRVVWSPNARMYACSAAVMPVSATGTAVAGNGTSVGGTSVGGALVGGTSAGALVALGTTTATWVGVT